MRLGVSNGPQYALQMSQFIYIPYTSLPPGNSIGPEGCTALAPALKEMEGLTELHLYGKCVIGGFGNAPQYAMNHGQYP